MKKNKFRWIALAGCGLMLLCSRSPKEITLRPWTDVETNWSAIACTLFSDSGFVLTDEVLSVASNSPLAGDPLQGERRLVPEEKEGDAEYYWGPMGQPIFYGRSLSALESQYYIFRSLFRFGEVPPTPHDPVIAPGMWSVIISEWGTDFEDGFWAAGTNDGVFRYVLLVGNAPAPWEKPGRVTVDLVKDKVIVFAYGYFFAHNGFDMVEVSPREYPYSLLESFCVTELDVGRAFFENQGGSKIRVELDLVGNGVWREAVFETPKIPSKHKFFVTKGKIELRKSYFGRDFLKAEQPLLRLLFFDSPKSKIFQLKEYELPGDKWLSTELPDGYNDYIERRRKMEDK